MTKTDIVRTTNTWSELICTKREFEIACKENESDFPITLTEMNIDLDNASEVKKSWCDGEMSDEAYYLAMSLILSTGV